MSKLNTALYRHRIILCSIACCALWLFVLLPGQLSSHTTLTVQLHRHAHRLPGNRQHLLNQRQMKQQQIKQQQAPSQVPDAPTVMGGPSSKTVADTSVLFGMIGRDIAGELPYILANIARLAEHFKEAHVVFVENDSADDTRGVFNTWAAAFTSGSAHNRTVKVLGFTPSTAGHKHPKVLAQARNRYLEQLVQPEYVAVNFLIAVDTDMCFPWDVKNMLKVINALLPAAGEAWHALYANGACGWYKDFFGSNKEEVPFFTAGSTPVYCDLFALRDSSGAAHTMADSMVFFQPGTCDLTAMPKKSAATFNCTYMNQHAVVPVQAAFGGWGMYDARMFRPSPGNKSMGCRHDEGDSGVCEHISLSNCLARDFGARQFISTALVVNWEGCSEKQQRRWHGWYPGRGPVET